MKKYILLISLALAIVTTVQADSMLKLGAKVPAFTLSDQNGKIVDLKDFQGKYLVIEWLNPDCPFCVRHYDENTMTKVQQKYAQKGVSWIAINSTKYMTLKDNLNWTKKYKIQYPILDDSSGIVGKLYGAKTTPHMFIIDKAGNLLYEGAIDDDPKGKNPNAINFVDKALSEILSGKSVSSPYIKSYGCSVKYKS